MEQAGLIDELHRLFLFEEFTAGQLKWVVLNAEVVELPAGSVLFTQLDADALWVLLEGKFQLTNHRDGREIVLLTTDRPGSWAGWLPAFDAHPIDVSAKLVVDSRLLRFGKDAVRTMISTGMPVANHFMQGVTTGARAFAENAAQRDKLAALGKLAAGLAHELNNPAAAARRAASDLRTALWERDARALILVRDLGEKDIVANLTLAREVVERPPLRLSPLDKSDREEEMAEWLESHGIGDGYTMAASFLEASITMEDLTGLETRLPAEALANVLCWLEAATAADELAEQIATSVARISDLVAAIKSYTYMDRAAETEVDVHRGIEDTLKILAYKLRSTNTEVVLDFCTDLPPIMAQGSALNLVWTNLIDNAVDAMGEGGTITIRTLREGDSALVEVADTGPGIPPELQSRIFEPFVTTKEVGKGTGLGLDTVWRTVRDHGGDIHLDSKPGDTRFQVRLPIVRRG